MIFKFLRKDKYILQAMLNILLFVANYLEKKLFLHFKSKRYDVEVF